MTSTRPTYVQWLVVAALLTLVGLALGYWVLVDDDEDKDYLAWVIVSLVNILIAAGFLLRFAPATERESTDRNLLARRGLVLGAVALVTVVLFWLGLPFSFGIPALAMGLRGRERAAQLGDLGIATTAAVLGGGAALLAFIGCIVG